jgi:23S rRNA-/tRNA-specific pseudouridylate synthase
MFEETLLLPNLFLHALRLEFEHPFTQEIIQINASKPDFWLEFERKIEIM